MQADAQFSFNVCFPFGGTSDVMGEPIEGTGWSPAWNDEPGGGQGNGDKQVTLFLLRVSRFHLFTPLRVGWPPTPQVYFGP